MTPTLSSVPLAAPVGGGMREIHLREYLRVLLRFRGLAVSVFSAVLVATLLITLAMPAKFRAEVKVAVIQRDPNIEMTRAAPLVPTADSFLQTQLQVLESWPVFEATARRLRLDREPLVTPFPLTAWLRRVLGLLVGKAPEPRTLFDATEELEANTRVQTVPESDVVTIQVQARTPELAQAAADTMAEVFSQRSLDLKSSQSSRDRRYLAERLEMTKQDQIDAEKELRYFESSNDTISLAKRIDYRTELRIRSEGELIDVERQVEEVSARLKPMLAQLSQARVGAARGDVESYGDVQQRLLDLKLRRAGLLKVYTSNHHLVQSVDEEMSLVRQKIARAEKAMIQGRSGSMTGMDTSLEKYNELLAELEGLRSRQSTLKALYSHYMEKLQADLELQTRHDFLRREVSASQRVFDLLLIRQKEAALKADMQISDVSVLEPAVLPREPHSPSLKLNLALGALLGGFLGIFAAFFRDYMDDVIRDEEHLEEGARLHLLASLPFLPDAEDERPPVDLAGEGPLADPLTLVSLSSELGDPAESGRLLLVTSAAPGEGKTTVAAHLAAAYARGGLRTLLLDGDLRRPQQAEAFDLPVGGLTLRELTADPTRELTPLAAQPQLTVVASRTPDPSPLDVLAKPAFAQALVKLRRQYDVIVIDTPPAGTVADALHLAALADRVILVARAGESRVVTLRRCAENLREVRGSVAGAVLNGVQPQDQSGGGYGTYEYDYAMDPGTGKAGGAGRRS